MKFANKMNAKNDKVANVRIFFSLCNFMESAIAFREKRSVLKFVANSSPSFIMKRGIYQGLLMQKQNFDFGAQINTKTQNG